MLTIVNKNILYKIVIIMYYFQKSRLDINE